MYAFDYHRPPRVAEAVAAARRRRRRQAAGRRPDLIPTLKLRLAAPVRPDRPRRASPSSRASRMDGGERRRSARMTTPRRGRRARTCVKRVIPALAAARRAASATRRCATAAPSAARSPTTTRPPTIPAAVLGLGATVAHQQARDRGRRLLHRACSRPRSSAGEIVTAVQLPEAGQGGLREVPATRPPATRWSACSSPGPAAACASPSPAPARACSGWPRCREGARRQLRAGALDAAERRVRAA